MTAENISFSCPAETETPNWRTTWGHRAAIADRVRQAVRHSVPIAPQGWDAYQVAITRVGPRTLDDDNLVSACKAARDEIARWLGVDDGAPNIKWVYFQRLETLVDDTPKKKRYFRTWLEVSVSQGVPVPVPLEPPRRLEREKTHAGVKVDTARVPLKSVPVGKQGLSAELAAAPDGRVYVRVCKHFVQQGHAWRTTGVAIDLEEVRDLIEALDSLTK